MTVSLKHTFQSAKPDGTDASLVQPSSWNAEHELTIATNKLLGRATAATGAAEEIAIGTALSISGGTLAVTTVPVANGGTGANTLTGYVKGSGTSAFTASATVPTSDLSGTLAAANGGTGLSSPGTSGNVLTSNGTAWVSATAGSAVYDLITTVNASGASTVDFTGLSSTYAAYQVLVTGLFGNTSVLQIQLRTSSDNGATFDSTAGDYAVNHVLVNDTGAVSGTSNSVNTSITTGFLNDSTYGNHLSLMLFNAGVSRPAVIDWTNGSYLTNIYHYRGLAFRRTTTPVNALRIFVGGGTLTGTFKLYGIKA